MNPHSPVHTQHDSTIRSAPVMGDNPPGWEKSSEKGWAINEVTARAGVSERLVRHCAMRGLISGQETATTHHYTYADVCVLRFVRRVHVLGFGMNQVARLLGLWHDMRRASPEAGNLPLSPVMAPPSHVDELRSIGDVLDRLAAAFQAEHQPACPILEALLEWRAYYSQTLPPYPG